MALRHLPLAIEQIDERIWEPELHRLMGLFLLDRSAPDEDQAETCFEKAIQFAQAQSTRSFELRKRVAFQTIT